MTAAQILSIPGGRKYWWDIADVERYIERKRKEKEENGGRDIKDARRELELEAESK